MVASSVSLEKVASAAEVNGTMSVNSESFYVDMRAKTSQAASEVIEVGASHATSNEEVISATETKESEGETTNDYHGNVMSVLPTSNSNFPILSLNVCGLRTKLNYPVFIENITRYKIVLLQESKANVIDSNRIELVCKNNDFTCFIKNRELCKRKSGGLVTLIANDIIDKVKEVTIENDVMQGFCISKSLFGTKKDMFLVNVYIPPPSSQYSNIDQFNDIEQALISESYTEKITLLCGDMNSHTGDVIDYIDYESYGTDESEFAELDIVNIKETLIQNMCIIRQNKDKRKIDVYGRRLIELVKNLGLIILNGRVKGDRQGEFTTTHNSVIDYCIGSPDVIECIDSLKIEDYDNIFSDVHCKVSLYMKNSISVSEELGSDCIKRINNCKPELLQQYHDNLNNDDIGSIRDLLSESDCDIDTVSIKVTSVLTHAAETTFGTKTKTINPNNKRTNFKSKEVRISKSNYYRTRRNVKKNSSEENKKEFKKACKKYKKDIKRFYHVRNENLVKRLRTLKSRNPKQYWQLLKEESRETLSVDMQSMFSHFKGLSSHQEINNHETNEEANIPYDDSALNSSITEQEIYNAVKKLKNSKSSGDDNVKNEYLKNSLPKMMDIYVKMFNRILDTGNFPESWGKGVIVPIYKQKGARQDPNNYRGITLLSNVSKLFTSIINDRLTRYIEENELLERNQTGFRKAHSTLDHIFVIDRLIHLCRFKKIRLFGCFVDYQKAFDTIVREKLYYKLNHHYLDKESKIFKIIVSMYENVKSCIAHKSKKSDFFDCQIGLRQGENLSPLLFSLYVNDLENYLLSNGSEFINLKDDDLNHYLKLLVLLYADDTVILADSAASLQRNLENLKEYCEYSKLCVNRSKTKVMIFGARRPKPESYNFNYDNEPLDIVNDFKYLGAVITYNGHFKQCQIENKQKTLRAMYALLSKCKNHYPPRLPCQHPPPKAPSLFPNKLDSNYRPWILLSVKKPWVRFCGKECGCKVGACVFCYSFLPFFVCLYTGIYKHEL